MLGRYSLGNNPLGFGMVSASPPNNEPTGSVTISGNSQVGQVLTANDTLADADGLGEKFYQWLIDDVEVDGATSINYIPVEADIDGIPKVTINYTDGEGNPESVTSDGYTAVIAASSEEGYSFFKPVLRNVLSPVLKGYDGY